MHDGGGVMKVLQRQGLGQTGLFQQSQCNDTGRRFAWTCLYSPQEHTLSDLDHGYFQDISVGPHVYKPGRYVCLDVDIDVYRVNPALLCTALIRIVLRDRLGMAFFQWRSAAIDQLYLFDSDTSHALSMSLPMPCSILQRMANRDDHQLQCLFEDDQGHVLDRASGEIAIQPV